MNQELLDALAMPISEALLNMALPWDWLIEMEIGCACINPYAIAKVVSE